MASAAGGRASDVVSAIALVSTTNTALLAVTAASRMLFAMAERDAVPRWIGRVSTKTRVPLVSLVAVTVLAAACTVLADLDVLAQVTDLSVYLVFVAVNVSVIVLRFQAPDAARPFRTPWSIGRLPILPLLGLLSIAVVFTGLDLQAALIGGAIAVAGLLAGLFLDARSPLRRRLAG